MSRRCVKRGSSLVEFTLVGIPLIFLITSLCSASLNMWQYHNLAYTVDLTTRYIASHGNVCTQSGNSCATTLGSIYTVMSKSGMALDPGKLNVTLTSASGSNTTCQPLSNCAGSSTQWPSSTDNAIGNDVKVFATYKLVNPIIMLWPDGNKVQAGQFTVGATARQRITF